MSELSVLEVGRITQALHERLCAAVPTAYLYGSSARGCPLARDLDVLLIVPSTGQADIFAAIADVQLKHKILIHPTVVSPQELDSNPLLRELVNSGTLLWPKD